MINWWEKYPGHLDFTPVLHTEIQEMGKGQKDRDWISNRGSLTFSLLLSPHELPSWTPLEIALLCRNFISQKFHIHLALKWPNDLVNSENKKFGGIICHMRKQKVVVGIGLNLFSTQDPMQNNYNCGYLFTEENQLGNHWQFLTQLSEYIISNRYISKVDIHRDWIKNCNHLNKFVTIDELPKSTQGTFLDLGEFGQAILVDEQGKQHQIANGSLTFN